VKSSRFPRFHHLSKTFVFFSGTFMFVDMLNVLFLLLTTMFKLWEATNSLHLANYLGLGTCTSKTPLILRQGQKLHIF
jgi:hypothetical protein